MQEAQHHDQRAQVICDVMWCGVACYVVVWSGVGVVWAWCGRLAGSRLDEVCTVYTANIMKFAAVQTVRAVFLLGF